MAGMNYRVVIDQEGRSYGASVPDLPGCVAVAESLEEVQLLISEAIVAHVALLRQQVPPVPELGKRRQN